MELLSNLLMDLGLNPRTHLLPGRPDRCEEQPMKAAPRPVRKVQDARQEVDWGRGKKLVLDTTPAEGAVVFEYTVQSTPAAAELPTSLPWTVYDEQAFQYEQARTKSFTLRQYRGLREAYLKDRTMTNAAAGAVYGKSESWGAKRLRAVRKAVDQIQDDLDAGKSLPYPE